MKVKAYNDLIAWQKAIALVKDIYAVTQRFPKEEIYGLTSQLRRAAVSIPSNIAEGQGRGSKNEFIHFLGNAKGSLFEVQTQVHIGRELNYMTDTDKKRLIDSSDEVGRIVNGLLNSLHHGGSD
jgi:four helix bundle protein